MGSLLYHLDNHHQEITHGGKPDLDYYGVRLTDPGCKRLHQELQAMLEEAVRDRRVRERYGLQPGLEEMPGLSRS